MRLVISSLLTLATAVLVAADVPLLNPPRSGITSGSDPSPAKSVPRIVGRMTNAKRFSMGLPPLKPKSLQRGTRVGSARRSNPSMTPPVPYSCNIRATGRDGTDFGFISPVWNDYGLYGQFQSSQDGALKITFSPSSDDPSSSQLDFTADNSPSATYPFFGAIAFDNSDLHPGSFYYVYIGGTTQSPAGSPPQSGDNSMSAATAVPGSIQSAVWTYNLNTQQITAQWINNDGYAPATYIVFSNSNQELFLTGDVGELQSYMGPFYSEVTFTCVAPLPVQLGGKE